MPSPIRGVPALTNTFSGVAGEARVAAELVRQGFKVAKPYWTDDEADLIVIVRANGGLLPIVVQVKAVQFLPDAKGLVPPRVYIQGLKKRYLSKSPAFVLALYRVDEDCIYLIPGPDKVIDVYESQQAFNPKHIQYSTLSDKADVRIALDFDGKLLSGFKVDIRNRSTVSRPLFNLVRRIEEDKDTVYEAIKAIWETESDDDVDSGMSDPG